MLESLRKVRYLASIALDRVDDYLQLVRISAELQRESLKKRIIGLLVVGVLLILALIFLGLAAIVTFWDTPYRTAAAWGVAVAYGLGAFIAYLGMGGRDKTEPASPFDTLRDELRRDVKLMRDVG